MSTTPAIIVLCRTRRKVLPSERLAPESEKIREWQWRSDQSQNQTRQLRRPCAPKPKTCAHLPDDHGCRWSCCRSPTPQCRLNTIRRNLSTGLSTSTQYRNCWDRTLHAHFPCSLRAALHQVLYVSGGNRYCLTHSTSSVSAPVCIPPPLRMDVLIFT